MTSDSLGSKPITTNNFGLFTTISLITSECVKFGHATLVLAYEFAKKNGVCECIDIAVENLYKHPKLGLALAACGAVCTLPIITFLFIAAISIVGALLGFLLIEGIFLSAAFIIFVPCFIAIVLLMVLVAVGLVITYVSSLTVVRFIQDKDTHKLLTYHVIPKKV